MRGIGIIWIFVFLLILFSAETCSDSQTGIAGEDKKSAMFRQIENDFLADELSSEILLAFEEKAIQKLNDLADYLSIYADSSISQPFRIQAKQMIEENFIHKDAELSFYRNLKLQPDTVNQLLMFSDCTGICKMEIKQISISKPLQKVSLSGYSGEIQFSFFVSHFKFPENIPAKSVQCSIEISAIKKEKNFGNYSQGVWEVYLGEIGF